jgi:AmmeMemoRadiSam system protein A
MTKGGLSAPSRQALLALARHAIEARLGAAAKAPEAGGPEWERPCGAFVTLRRRSDGELRGCVGYVEPRFPLRESVTRAAVAAALEDGRFDGVTLAELPSLSIEISVLGRTRPIRPDHIVVGTHGLILRCAGRGGLLLPQVATEHGWDREQFLEQTCRKAALPSGSWTRPDAELLAFTAEVFGEA